MLNEVIFKASSSDLDDTFVGFKIINNKPYFYYPSYYVMPKKYTDKLVEARKILRTLFLTKRSQEKSTLFNKSRSLNDLSFESFYFLINHYFKFKRYENNEKKILINSGGKVEWKKTFKKTPLVSKEGLFFKDMMFIRKQHVDNFISQAYLYAVSKSISNIGWIFGINEKIKFDYYNLNIFLSAINKELNSTFNENKRQLLLHIKNALKGVDSQEDNSNLIFGVNSFEYAYERMIDSIFSNIKNIDEYYPSAKWIIKDKLIKTRNLRPDTIIEKENEIIIIDSKYYGFSKDLIRRLPQSSDIQKQLTYEEFVKNYLSKNKKIYNLFLLPKKEDDFFIEKLETNIKEYISYYGYAISDWKGQKGKVHGFLIDLNKLINDFLTNDKGLNQILFNNLSSLTSE
jgi:hypothetical protein